MAYGRHSADTSQRSNLESGRSQAFRKRFSDGGISAVSGIELNPGASVRIERRGRGGARDAAQSQILHSGEYSARTQRIPNILENGVEIVTQERKEPPAERPVITSGGRQSCCYVGV